MRAMSELRGLVLTLAMLVGIQRTISLVMPGSGQTGHVSLEHGKECSEMVATGVLCLPVHRGQDVHLDEAKRTELLKPRVT